MEKRASVSSCLFWEERKLSEALIRGLELRGNLGATYLPVVLGTLCLFPGHKTGIVTTPASPRSQVCSAAVMWWCSSGWQVAQILVKIPVFAERKLLSG